MAKLEEVFRQEICRLARKEIRTALEPLVQQVRELRRQVAQLQKGAPAAVEVDVPEPIDLEANPDEVSKARFSAGLIKKLRRRLNITQVELATLLGTSATTVAFWEQGRNRPTDSSQTKLVALRKLGRRDVKRMLKR